MSVHLARPGITGHQIRRLLRNERQAGFLLSEAPRGQERYRLADRGRYTVGERAHGTIGQWMATVIDHRETESGERRLGRCAGT